jgi:hypothetical protein
MSAAEKSSAGIIFILDFFGWGEEIKSFLRLPDSTTFSNFVLKRCYVICNDGIALSVNNDFIIFENR